MDEKIKELATEAGFQPFEDCGPGYVYKMEKFAELIIKECAGLLVKEAESNHDENTPTYDILIQESNWMKKHFGVE